MKTNKLWSIIMMLVLVLGTVISFSSCNNDDDEEENENNSNFYIIDGKKYSADLLEVFNDGDEYGFVLISKSTDIELEFGVDALGKNVDCGIEIEDGGEEFEDDMYAIGKISVTKSGDTFTIELPKTKTRNGKHTVSAYYKGVGKHIDD